MVKALVTHRSISMTHWNGFLGAGDARLNMTASWVLIELEDGPQVRKIKINKVVNI